MVKYVNVNDIVNEVVQEKVHQCIPFGLIGAFDNRRFQGQRIHGDFTVGIQGTYRINRAEMFIDTKGTYDGVRVLLTAAAVNHLLLARLEQDGLWPL